MTKPRRRQACEGRTPRREAGQGGYYRYSTKAGETRFYIKLTVLGPDGKPKVLVRRKARPWAEPARKNTRSQLEDRAGLPFTDEWHALAELDAIRAEIRAGTYFQRLNPAARAAGETMTVERWLDRWLSVDLVELVADNTMRASTLASYRKNARLHLIPELGHVPLADLTIGDIRRMRSNLRDHGRKDHRAGEGLAPKTVDYCTIILQGALTDAVEQGIIAVNPALQKSRRGRRDKSRPGAGESRAHVWDKAQMADFLGWCQRTEAADEVAYFVLSYTGLRRGELMALRWGDLEIDWKDTRSEHGVLWVRRSVGVVKTKGERERLIEDRPKNGKPRPVELTTDTVRAIRSWRAARAEITLGARESTLVSPDALVFGTIEGNYRHPERFSRQFVAKQRQWHKGLLKAGAPEANLPPLLRLHDLRHTHGTQLYKDGWPVKLIAERLGHDEIVLLRTYAHLDQADQRAAIRRFESTLRVDGSA